MNRIMNRKSFVQDYLQKLQYPHADIERTRCDSGTPQPDVNMSQRRRICARHNAPTSQIAQAFTHSSYPYSHLVVPW
jgi:hypothetical protein